MKSNIFWIVLLMLGPPLYMMWPALTDTPFVSTDPNFLVICALSNLAGWMMGFVAGINWMLHYQENK